jgi:AraC-like DNA-binding protein
MTENMNIAIYTHNINTPEMSIGFPLHWHSEYEIIYVYKGHTVFDIEGISYTVKEGQGVIIHQDAIHSCNYRDDKTVNYTCIVFGEKFLISDNLDAFYNKFFYPLYKNNAVPPVFLSGELHWERAVLECVRRLLSEHTNKSPAYLFYVKIQLMEIFYLMIKEDVFKPAVINEGSHGKKLREAILLIQQNYNKPIHVHELAKTQNLCHEYFTRLFHSMTGVTPKAYITNYRLEQAEVMLASGGDSISNVAARCGFDDVNYFSRCFKKVKGYPPSAVKRK